MKYKRLISLNCFLLVWILAASLCWGGQVVTDDTRQWARQALQEEKALEAVSGRNTLAILNFHNKTGKPDLDPVQKGMSLMLITDLSTIEGLQVVERVKLQALTEEMGLGTSGLVEESTAPRIGNILGAEWLLGGDILRKEPEDLRIQSNLLDVPVSKILGEQAAEGGLSELFRMEKDLLFDIIKLLKIELTPEQKAVLRKPCSTNDKALMALFKGIDASDQGYYEEAAKQYKSALGKDPAICISGDALTELKTLGLIRAVNRSKDMLRTIQDRTSQTDKLTPDESEKKRLEPKDVTTPIDIDLNFPQ